MKARQLIILFIIMLITTGNGFSQFTSLTVFSEKGEKFNLYVNGDLKNNKPDKHVRVEDIGGPTFKVMVEFPDQKIPPVSKTIFNKPSAVFYYVVRQDKKGNYILEHTSSDYVQGEEAVKEDNPPPPPPAHEKNQDQKSETAPKKSTGGCPAPMAEPDFQASVVMISNAPFEGPKLSQAKKVAESHCLECRQIRELLYTVSNESSRLSLAKAAYTHCYDPDNYDEVKEVLNSSKSKEDLDKYIGSVK
jgi:hypothetical protein